MIKRIWNITLTVKNLENSIRFYEEVPGLQKKYVFSDHTGSTMEESK